MTPSKISVLLLMAMCGLSNAQIGAPPTPTVEAPTGPSLEDTQRWISEKVQAVRIAYTEINSITTFPIKFKDCEMTSTSYRVTTNAVTGATIDVRETSITNLAELDENAMIIHDLPPSEETGKNPGYSRLWIYSLGKQDLISWRQDANPPFINAPRPRMRDSVYFYFQGREMAERSKTAFQHTIRLCVKRSADRKAAEPPKPKEIF